MLIRLQYVHTTMIATDGFTKPLRSLKQFKAWKDIVQGTVPH
jgi:hypothetical protein